MESNNGPAWANAAPQQSVTTVEDHEKELFRPYSTLDETVMETIMRDVRAVGVKLKVVMMPLDRSATSIAYAAVSQSLDDAQPTEACEELSENDRKVIQQLKDWDLWGPLVLCLSLAVILSFRAPTDQAALVFAAVFCAVWVGGTVVTVNAQLLGGTISFFQSLCVLGYCVFPLTLAAIAIGCMKLIINTWMWIDFILVAVGFVWATRSSSVFISLYVRRDRRFLALYPVFFFYTFLGWLILLF
jgi:hypothetical protein